MDFENKAKKISANGQQIKNGRVTKPQKNRLLEIMKQNRSLGTGQLIGRNARQTQSEEWEKISKKLNSLGGCCKNAEQWKKTWVNWKAYAKKQNEKYKAFRNQTGNLPATEGPKPMDPIDVEVLDFFARDMVDGDGCTPEGGVENELVDKDVVEVDCEGNEVLYVFQPISPKKTTSKTPSTRVSIPSTSKSVVEEVEQKCAERHREIMEALSSITAILKDIRNALQNK